MIVKLERYVREMNWVDVYFKKESEHSNNRKTLSVRLGIPGNDVFASDSGDNWIGLMSGVEEKLRQQLEKR